MNTKSVKPQPNDLILQSLMLEESYIASGVSVKLTLAEYNIPDVGYKPDITYTEEVTTHIWIDETNTPKLLKQLGWNVESDDQTHPLIISVPRYIHEDSESTVLLESSDYKEVKLSKYAKVTLDYSYEDIAREFIVTEVTDNMFNPVFHYAKIVPYRERVEVDPDPVNDPNLNHLINHDQGFKHLTIPGQRNISERR